MSVHTPKQAPIRITSSKKLSAAAVRRIRLENVAAKAAEVELLPAHLLVALEKFVPHSLTNAEWQVVRPIVHQVMKGSKIRGIATFPQHLSDLTLYIAWCARRDIALEVTVLFDHALIEEWVRTALADLDDTTRTTRRSRLRSLASHINPGPTAPRASKPIARKAVRPPYEDYEVATIIRLANCQPTSGMRRQLCAMVGLGLGAGLDSSDLKPLINSHIEDRGVAGIWINVPTPRPRVVVVRRGYEDLVRIGLEGLSRNALVFGVKLDRRNVTANIVFNAIALGNAPRIEQSRLRSTWLVELMNARIPLSVLMRAAGLRGARTLTDLLPFALARLTTGLDQDGFTESPVQS